VNSLAYDILKLDLMALASVAAAAALAPWSHATTRARDRNGMPSSWDDGSEILPSQGRPACSQVAQRRASSAMPDSGRFENLEKVDMWIECSHRGIGKNRHTQLERINRLLTKSARNRKTQSGVLPNAADRTRPDDAVVKNWPARL
jgi:hypothetical protein